MDQEADAMLGELLSRPFTIARPERQSAPFVFASPHSGRLYPPSFLALSALAPKMLRRAEDAFVEELFAGAVALGAPLIAARFPRVFVDVNRAPGELDPAMFGAPLPQAIEAHSPRVAAGLGVIPRLVREGAPIYRAKLAPGEAQLRLMRLHRPYHAALAGLVEETRARFGVATVVDCHSMPSGGPVADIVLGDRYGASAPAELMRHAELSFQSAGFSTARNTPYAGGYTTHLYARHQDGICALQIEVNRALYLDEDRIERGAGFEQTRARLARALCLLIGVDVAILRQRPPLAAE